MFIHFSSGTLFVFLFYVFFLSSFLRRSAYLNALITARVTETWRILSFSRTHAMRTAKKFTTKAIHCGGFYYLLLSAILLVSFDPCLQHQDLEHLDITQAFPMHETKEIELFYGLGL